jgi:hypothetical protein
MARYGWTLCFSTGEPSPADTAPTFIADLATGAITSSAPRLRACRR